MAGIYDIEGRPGQDPEQDEAQEGFTLQDREEQEEQIRRRKDGIRHQIEQGNAPESILYSALKVIADLTDDPKFFDVCTAPLDAVYSDLAQQSLLNDNAAIAAARLERMQKEYRAKLARQLKRNKKAYKEISTALERALQAVENLEEENAPE